MYKKYLKISKRNVQEMTTSIKCVQILLHVYFGNLINKLEGCESFTFEGKAIS